MIALIASGCRKPAENSRAESGSKMAVRAQTTGDIRGRMVRRPPEDADIPPPAVLERDYLATTDLDSRLEIMSQLADLGTPETVRTLAKLYPVETDLFLKSEIVSRLGSADAEVEARLEVFAAALAPSEPDELRQTAIAELDTIDDPLAIPIWKALLNDPDEGFRDRAGDALEHFRMIRSQK